ncbi:MAG: hypothetical protein GAK30_03377 [Paracidovorax wautersii]|uniref:DUF2844 domain-containing protein n=1 Tax=Paracidovorax wautersii TaxID=1177982 RepID=A0A7V8FLC5_9BURK|nr:MAG: hypothetical protein GAK30_03377 [Paracidovorax wautersii]
MTPPAGDTQATTRSLEPTIKSQAQGTTATTAAASFTVRETTLGSGTVIREYLDTNGIVFGLAWRGPVKPDLAELLGNYFPQYTAAIQAARAARGPRSPVAVEADNLVVRAGGHMGSFSGQAWLPQALPAGVAGSDIQ